MKLLKSLILVVAAGLVITACGGGASTPSDVVKKFNEATLKLDLKEAKKYVAKAHYEDIDKLIAKIETPEVQPMLEVFKASVKDAKFEIIGEEIAEDGNTATVKVKVSVMGQENEEDTPLIKEDGQWKIDKKIDIGK
ncbi:MAG: DUF4878 domain-containing protein [Prevotellaceae bacterium]|jgi:ABC-type glycerol-3-phosphate transport system substrate-binding protein|nr:DUF4878 domain-containing protein [Prevotellaceae bacterium]